MDKEIFLNNSVIKEFSEILGEKYLRDFKLVGGAVVDILEGRKPKDYDFVGFSDTHINMFKEHGFKFLYKTKTAKTYQKGDIIIQFIEFSLEQFGFTIEQSSFNFKTKELEVDGDSFETKTLIPVSFEIKQNVVSAMRRIYHWRKKGYEINEMTYLSLVNQLVRSNTPIGS